MLNLNWAAMPNGFYADPKGPFKAPEDAFGVYVIWQLRCGSYGPFVIRAGSGHIRSRISNHMQDPQITSFRPLRFSYARIPRPYALGVERYLGEALSPLVGDRFPDVCPIRVNVPDFYREVLPGNALAGLHPRHRV